MGSGSVAQSITSSSQTIGGALFEVIQFAVDSDRALGLRSLIECQQIACILALQGVNVVSKEERHERCTKSTSAGDLGLPFAI